MQDFFNRGVLKWDVHVHVGCDAMSALKMSLNEGGGGFWHFWPFFFLPEKKFVSVFVIHRVGVSTILVHYWLLWEASEQKIKQQTNNRAKGGCLNPPPPHNTPPPPYTPVLKDNHGWGSCTSAWEGVILHPTTIIVLVGGSSFDTGSIFILVS